MKKEDYNEGLFEPAENHTRGALSPSFICYSSRQNYRRFRQLNRGLSQYSY